MNLHLVPADHNDARDLMALRPGVRADLDAWVAALDKVTKPYQQSLAEIARRFGVSIQTARRRYYDWRKTRDFRVLIDRRENPAERGLDLRFIEYWKSLCEDNSRKCKPAYRKLCRQFFAGESIPGLDVNTPRTHLPKGWTYCNLMLHAPKKRELVASRIGFVAAQAHRSFVFTSRVGMEVGQRYIFDDLWHDFEVAHVGRRESCRLLQLHALDLFSGCQIARLCKPRLEDPETGVRVSLKEHEMLFLVTHVLENLGYHPGGCVLMVEHGTAALDDKLAEVIYRITGGRVTVERGDIQGAGDFAGQYGGQGKGNFRFKGALESLGNLIHNETGDRIEFPGQTGSNSRVNAVEELVGRRKEFSALMKALDAMPEERRAILKFPFLEVHAAEALVNDVQDRMNARTDHALEGWKDAGLTTMDFFLEGVGVVSGDKVLALDEAKRAAFMAVAKPNARLLSPLEVWNKGRTKLQRLRPEHAAMLLGTKVSQKGKVNSRGLIEFEDARISPNTLRYSAHTFAEGDEFGVVVNPFAPEKANLFDAKGAWVGVVKSWQTVSDVDADGIHEQMKRAAQAQKEAFDPLKRRAAKIIRQRTKDAKHNTDVVRGQDKQTKRERSDADDALAHFGH